MKYSQTLTLKGRVAAKPRFDGDCLAFSLVVRWRSAERRIVDTTYQVRARNRPAMQALTLRKGDNVAVVARNLAVGYDSLTHLPRLFVAAVTVDRIL